MDSVQITEDGTQSFRFLSMLRLKMCVRCTCGISPLQRILATDCPTVPNPRRATRATTGAFDVTYESFFYWRWGPTPSAN